MKNLRTTTFALFAFALSLTIFKIQSGDVFMYLALARDFIFGPKSGAIDPYLYSLSNATLVWTHEWLSYVVFYGAWLVGGAVGLTLVKVLTLSAVFALVLRRRGGGLWPGLWMIGITAASFRFIERSSLASDLILSYLIARFVDTERVTRAFAIELGVVFLIWAQLHPGYPLGFALLGLWAINRRAWSPWLAVPFVTPLLNPDGVTGYLYPFRFALNEARTLKHYNFEWFPTYHPAFRFAPEIIAYWAFLILIVTVLIRARRPRDVRTWLTVAALGAGTQAVRFVPFAVFASLIATAPWATLEFVRVPRWAGRALVAGLVVLAIKNFAFGYASSSGPRKPGFGFDSAYVPTTNFELIRTQSIPGQLFNTHDFGSIMIWAGLTPVFHHGFVTDMDFYRREVVGVLSSRDVFLQLTAKYGWTMLLVDKLNGYRTFHAFLKDSPEWQIVGEDDASYLIYRRP